MPYNGAGVFNRLYNWVTDAANALKISSPRMDGEFDGMATALTNCITRDGQSPAVNNIPMGGFKITGLGNGVAASDAATVGQLPVVPSPTAFTCLSVSANAPQTGLGTVASKVMFPLVWMDLQGEWNTTLSRFTATRAGNYLVNATIIMRAAGVGSTNGLRIQRNGVALFGVGYMAPAANIDVVVPLCGVYPMSIGDYFEIFVQFGAGSTNILQATAATLGNWSELSITQVR